MKNFFCNKKLTRHTSGKRTRGFSLLELLIVLSIVSVLAALLLPVFLTVRGQARQTVCSSNLRQIGLSFAMYAQDSDGLYPFAIDPSDRYASGIWDEYPEFKALLPQLPMLHDVLQPYAHSRQIFRCAADSGFVRLDFANVALQAQPSSYEKFGTSYYYRTEIALRQAGEPTFKAPAQTNVLMDGVGHWHGTLTPLAQRYNFLFADGHVKNISRSQADEIWKMPL